jgi:hypothetical protein
MAIFASGTRSTLSTVCERQGQVNVTGFFSPSAFQRYSTATGLPSNTDMSSRTSPFAGSVRLGSAPGSVPSCRSTESPVTNNWLTSLPPFTIGLSSPATS